MEQKPDKSLKNSLLLVIVGVTLLVALQHLNLVAGALGMMIGLVMPLIAGGIIAFILNVPMNFLEKKIEWLSTRYGWRVLRRGKSALSLIATLVLVVLAVSFVGRVIFPNMAESIKSIAAIVNENYQSWIALAESYGLDMSGVKAWIVNFDWEKLLQGLRDQQRRDLVYCHAGGEQRVRRGGKHRLRLDFCDLHSAEQAQARQAGETDRYAYLKKSWADEVATLRACRIRRLPDSCPGNVWKL